MSASGDKYAAIRGHFPGEGEHVMPSLVERLVAAGVVTPPDQALLEKIAAASGGPAPSAASATPAPSAPPQAAKPAASAPVAAPSAPPQVAKPAASAPVAASAPAAGGPISVQRQPVLASKKDIDDAIDGMFASREDSKLMSAVPAGPLSTRISKMLPAVGDEAAQDSARDSGSDSEDDGEEYAGAMRGGDDDLLEDDSDDDFEVVVEEPIHTPEPVVASAPAPAPTPAPTAAPVKVEAPKPAPTPAPSDHHPKHEAFIGRIAPSTKIMTDENIEDLLAGATGPTLKDFKESGLADDWFGDEEFTGGKNSFDDLMGGGDEGAAPAPAPTPMAAPAPAPKAPKPVEVAAPAYQEVETDQTSSNQADEDAADDLLADLGLTSSSGTGMKAASSPQVTGKPYDRFDAVAVHELESAADELLRDIATHLKSKGLDTPPKLQRRLDTPAARQAAHSRQEEQIVITEEEPVALAPSPAVESRASIPSPARVAAAPAPSPRPMPAVAAKPAPQAASPSPRDAAPKDSTIDMGTVARKRAAESAVTPEDSFGETIEKAKDIGSKATLILSREDMDRAGKVLVLPQELPVWKVYLGAAGIVLVICAGIIAAMFYSFTGTI